MTVPGDSCILPYISEVEEQEGIEGLDLPRMCVILLAKYRSDGRAWES